MNRRTFLNTGTKGLVAAAAVAGVSRKSLGDQTAAAGAGGGGCEPRISGSFFDIIHVNWWDAAYWTDTCFHWGEANWRALIRDMHGVGIDTAICGATAFWGRPVFPGYEKTVGKPIRFECTDPLGVCVDEAERLGMKVFFGIGLRGRCSQVRDYADMSPPWPEVWFRWNTALAEAIVDRFGGRKCFGGLYISYEIDFHDHQVALYEKLVKQYLRPVIGPVRILASPGSLGDHRALNELPRQLERTGINIVAPQDYGGRSNDIRQALELVRRNAQAMERIGTEVRKAGVALWCNCELFDFEGDPAGRGMCVPGPIERIRQQIALQAPLAEKLLCYQYQGIMNRRSDLVNIGRPDSDTLYRGYVAYLNERFPGRFKGSG